MIEIGKNIAAYRTEAKETQADLGALLGVSDKTVSKWESGDTEPNLDTVCRIAEHYRVTVDVLLGKPYEDVQTVLANEFSRAENRNDLFTRLYQEMLRLLHAAVGSYNGDRRENAGPVMIPNSSGKGRMRSVLTTDVGQMFMMSAPDMNIGVAQFQNESNFRWMMDKPEDLANLFAVFADPCAVKLVYILCRADFPKTFTAGYAAEKAGIPCEKAAEILDRLSVYQGDCNYSVSSMTADLTEGTVKLYEFMGNGAYLAMMSMANLIVYGIDCNWTAHHGSCKLIREEK